MRPTVHLNHRCPRGLRRAASHRVHLLSLLQRGKNALPPVGRQKRTTAHRVAAGSNKTEKRALHNWEVQHSGNKHDAKTNMEQH